jgi:hypothetical protein
MTELQPKLFELSRINAELYQLHSRLKRESEAGSAPAQLEQLRTSIRDLDAASERLLTEVERLRAAGADVRGRP